MAKLLTTWLIVTGVGSLIVINWPGLVMVGFLLLVIPGLIMSLLPTVFLWSAAFAVFWFPLRHVMGETMAALASVPLAILLLMLIPLPFTALAEWQYRDIQDEDVMPSIPVKLSGDILLERQSTWGSGGRRDMEGNVKKEDRGILCSATCQAMLFTPSITSVTAVDGDEGPVTFRLSPREQCGEAVDLAKASRGGEALTLAWAARMREEDLCIERLAVAVPDHDYRVRFVSELTGTLASNWTLAPGRITDRRVEIHRDEELLLRASHTDTYKLMKPLTIEGVGGISDFRFRWARKYRGDRKAYPELDTVAALDEHSNVVFEADASQSRDLARRALASFLATPSLPADDPATGMVRPYFESFSNFNLPKGATQPEATEQDFDLVRSMILDERITSFGWSHDLLRKLEDDLPKLREPLVERMSSVAPTYENFDVLLPLQLIFEEQPEGAFRDMTAAEKALVADPEQVRLASGLVRRQADRGAAAVPLLLDIYRRERARIAAHFAQKKRNRSEPKDARWMVSAVETAFCLIGMEARTALPTVEAMIADGMIREHGHRDFHIMLARMGKPIKNIPKPDNLSGSEAQFQDRLQRRLDNFDPSRHCR